MEEELDAVEISNVDLTIIESRVYFGKAEAGLITIEV